MVAGRDRAVLSCFERVGVRVVNFASNSTHSWPFKGRDKLKALSASSYIEQLVLGDVGATRSVILCFGDSLARARAVLTTCRRCISPGHEEGMGVELREGGRLVGRADSQWTGPKAPPFLKEAGTGKEYSVEETILDVFLPTSHTIESSSMPLVMMFPLKSCTDGCSVLLVRDR